eukprot:6073173-Pyramimonas_sp.AAC.2
MRSRIEVERYSRMPRTRDSSLPFSFCPLTPFPPPSPRPRLPHRISAFLASSSIPELRADEPIPASLASFPSPCH